MNLLFVCADRLALPQTVILPYWHSADACFVRKVWNRRDTLCCPIMSDMKYNVMVNLANEVSRKEQVVRKPASSENFELCHWPINMDQFGNDAVLGAGS
jgi:hypothetical protein